MIFYRACLRGARTIWPSFEALLPDSHLGGASNFANIRCMAPSTFSDLSMVLTMRLILGLGSTSQIISRAADVLAELASFARESAYAF